MKTLRVDFSCDAFEELEKIRYQLRKENDEVPTRADVLSLGLGMLRYLVNQKKSGKQLFTVKNEPAKKTTEFDFPDGWKVV